MEFIQLIKNRYSVRAFKPDLIDDDSLEYILGASCLAPTAANRQPFQLIVIHTNGRQEELRKIYDKPWFTQAPIVICAVGFPTKAWTRIDNKNYMDVDVAIAMDHLILAASELNIGTCWVAAFDPIAARKVLNIPDDAEPIVFTPLGYPADQPKRKIRKSLDEIVLYEKM